MAEIKQEVNEKGHQSFNIYEDDVEMGEMTFGIKGNEMTVYHTLVMPEARGLGFAKQLLEHLVGYAREHGLMVVAKCPYVRKEFGEDEGKYGDVWKKS